jgi:nucleotide sugar dehydrogenase
MDRQNNDYIVTVIGLGKIGLTLSSVIAGNGIKVIGVDKNQSVVEVVNKGECHISGEPGLNELVMSNYLKKKMISTTDTQDAVSKSNVVIVIVPVLIYEDNHVNYSYIDDAVKNIGESIREGTCVIFETTLPTGDTRNRFGRTIEKLSGLKMGQDFYLAYSPERVYSNKIIDNLKQYPKVVGGVNEESKKRAVNFYKAALGCEIIEMSSTEAAEFAKVAESVYRDVNIALVNELAVYGDQMGVDITEVVQASNSQPFSHLHQPGIGVGGHCIPIYPYFFLNNGLANNGLVNKARKINDSMADYSLKLIENEIKSIKDKKVLILGVSFRENVKEHTKSISLKLNELLKGKGADVFVNDPFYTQKELKDFDMKLLALDDQMTEEIDVIILQAYHNDFKSINLSKFKACEIFLDGRNTFDKEFVRNHGIKYLGIGTR